MLLRLLKLQFSNLVNLNPYGQRFIEWGFSRYNSLKLIFINFKVSGANFNSRITKSLFLEYNQNRSSGPKSKICYAPFNNLHFQMNGDVSACSFNYDLFLGNVFQQSITSIWNGISAQEIRNKLGNFDLEKCQTCSSVIQAKNFMSFPASKYDEYGSEKFTFPSQISFELSNKCNFECIMCNEDFSSSIASKKGIPHNPYKDYPESFYEEFTTFAKHIRIATFIGGEPLLIKQYYRIWQIILQENKKCRIHIQTNGSTLPKSFLSLLKSSQFDLGFSMDACNKDLFEKIRLNSNFDEVLKNFETIIGLRSQHDIFINLNFCPLTENWENIPDMIIFANKYNVSLKIVNVDNPKHLALSSQTKHYLEGVYQFLESNLNKVCDETTIIRKRNYKSYANFLSYVLSLIKEADRRIMYMDQRKLMSLDESLSDLFNCIQVLKNFKNFNNSDKELIYNSISNYVSKLTHNQEIQRNVINRFIYSLKISEHPGDGKESRVVEDGLKLGYRILYEYYLLESTQNNESS